MKRVLVCFGFSLKKIPLKFLSLLASRRNQEKKKRCNSQILQNKAPYILTGREALYSGHCSILSCQKAGGMGCQLWLLADLCKS
jgi:hypothetical protein